MQIQARFNEGLALHRKGLLVQAQNSFHHVLLLQPRHFEALYMLGMLAGQTGNSAQAVEWIDKAIEVNPNYASAYSNRGNALKDLKQHLAAINSYDKAIAIKPDFAEAHWNQGLCYLQMGDLERGWIKHERRWKNERMYPHKDRRDFTRPLWLGAEPLKGKTILLHCEQGLGDPSAKLYRQDLPGDWERVFKRVAADLKHIA